MALKEPNMNNLRRQPEVKVTYKSFRSEGAEYEI